MTFMIGQQFPNITTPAVDAQGNITDNFNVHDYADGQHTIVFWYPLDFTFVCPTELVAFDQAMGAFRNRNCKVVAASVDSAHCHAAWRRTPLNDGGIGEVSYPMIADVKRELSTALGIVSEGGVTFRATYLLDAKGIVRHMLVNDLPLGRNVEETLRMVDALQFFEQHGEVCPANWKQGQSGMAPTRESTASHLSSVSNSVRAA